MDEQQLIRSLRESNMDSFETLFHRYYPRFYKFILGFVKDKWVAEDLTQNVFMKLWLKRTVLDENMKLSTFLYTVAKYEIYNNYRLKRNQQELPIDNTQDLATDFVEDVHNHYDFNLMQEVIHETIANMPEKRRIVFTLNRINGLSAQEIANQLGISVRTVEKHIELAMREIRLRLSPFKILLLTALLRLHILLP